MKKVHTLVRYLGICDGNMQEGSFRCDANVSVRPDGHARNSAPAPRSRTSTRFAIVEKAINFEVARQIELLEGGGKVVQETRLYDPDEARRARCARRKKRTTTAISPIRICCRSSSTTAYIDSVEGAAAGTAGREGAALRRAIPALGVRRAGADREPRTGRLLRDRRARSSAARPNSRPTGSAVTWRRSSIAMDSRSPPAASAPTRSRALLRRIDDQTHLRQDRQGRVRGDVGRAAIAPTRSSRRAGLRQITDDGSIEQAIAAVLAAHPGAAGRLPRRQGQVVRLLRRSGHEGDAGQGES